MTNTNLELGIIKPEQMTVKQVLSEKHALDYYQREYMWEEEQVRKLLEDLENAFLSHYHSSHDRKAVKSYPHYFLGPIIISVKKDGTRNIVDGQQRLTTLTLLIIYLYWLQRQGIVEESECVKNLDLMVRSEDYGEASYNLSIEERNTVMDYIFSLDDPEAKQAKGDGEAPDYKAEITNQTIENLIGRYKTIQEVFPEQLSGKILPYFIDWLKDSVDFVLIQTYNDSDAYTVFETMNDRGLRLSQADMLKSYLLSQIHAEDKKKEANKIWRELTHKLNDIGKSQDAEFIKHWLRAKHAKSKRAHENGKWIDADFENISQAFHKWVREKLVSNSLDDNEKDTHFRFITTNFRYFAEAYLDIRKCASTFKREDSEIFFNAHNGFTLQYPLLLAPLRTEDSKACAERKLKLMATFLDLYIIRHVVNNRALGYSNILYRTFDYILDVRDASLEKLAQWCANRIKEIENDGLTLDGINSWAISNFSKRYIKQFLARITYFIDKDCGENSEFDIYIRRKSKKFDPFEIEHVWSNNYELNGREFGSLEEFQSYRNRVGGLLLLPKSFNQSFGALPYEEKLEKYFGQNYLVKSLNELAYSNDPKFETFRSQHGLDFKPYDSFTKQALDERQGLYCEIAKRIWSSKRIEDILND